MKIQVATLRKKVLHTLQHSFNESDANRIADYLLWSDMSGISTQGIIKLTGKEPLQNIKADHVIKIDRDTKLSQLINAGLNPAPLVSQIATEKAIEKAKEHGFGIVGVHNTKSSNGAQAFYAELISNQNLLGIVTARPPAVAAAFGGIDPIFGTNPICFSFPTNNEPLTFDMATAAMTFYGLILAKAQGKEIPENMAIDHEGNPTTDPEAAMGGALLSFDRSYKGSGLGMVVEVLAGPLVKAAYGQVEGEWGNLFIALDPNLLVDTAEFKNHCSSLITKIKSSRKKAGVEEIIIPGEFAHTAYKQAQETGIVEVDDAILQQLGYI